MRFIRYSWGKEKVFWNPPIFVLFITIKLRYFNKIYILIKQNNQKDSNTKNICNIKNNSKIDKFQVFFIISILIILIYTTTLYIP